MVKIKEIDKCKYLLHSSLYGGEMTQCFKSVNLPDDKIYKLWIYADTIYSIKRYILYPKHF